MFSVLAVILMAMPVAAQDSLLVSYQGYLTDDQGNPVNGTESMTFTIYDTGGVSKWTETQPSVPVNEGYFTAILGSQTALPDSVFNGEDRYLGIAVGGDPEISPRTLFTSVASAAYTKKVEGDITVGDLELSFYDPAGGFPDDPSMKMGVEPSPFIEMTEQSLGFGDRPLMKMGVEPTPFHRGYLSFRYPDLNPPPSLFNLGVVNDGSEWSSGIDMYLVHPPEYPSPEHILSISSAPSTGANIRMVHPPEKDFMTFSGIPSSGASIKMFNPDPNPAARIMEMGIVTDGPEWSSGIDMYLVHPPEYPDPAHILSIGSAPSTGASFRMFNPQPEPPAMIMELWSREESSEWSTGFKTYNPLGTYPTTTEIELISSETGNNFKLGNISGDMGTSGIAMTADGTAATMLMANGPGAPLSVISMSTNFSSARIGIGNEAPTQPLVVGNNLGTFGGKRIIIGDATAGTESGIVMGEDNDNRGWILWNVDNDYMGMGTRETGGVYGATLVLNSGDVGIGTDSPGEDLHVVGDICYTGTSGACSDRRYKKNISTLAGALDKVTEMRGVEFNWRKDEYPENDFSDENQVGFIAQELNDVLPEVVSEDNNGYYNIDYGKITPLLVEAIKDQQRQIDDLTRRIAELEGTQVSSR